MVLVSVSSVSSQTILYQTMKSVKFIRIEAISQKTRENWQNSFKLNTFVCNLPKTINWGKKFIYQLTEKQ